MARASLSLSEARRMALAAQGFGAKPGAPTARAMKAMVAGLGLVQIDSVNVLARSHYLPAFSRLGAYDRAALDALAWGKRPALFEYWAHEASLLPIESQPLFRWRMAQALNGELGWDSVKRMGRERAAFTGAVKARIAAEGALPASAFDMGKKGEGGWWGWSEAKRALEYLFWSGQVTTRTRRTSFERVYDLTERVIPSAVLNAPTPSAADAQRALVEIAARAMGVASRKDLRDYFRLSPTQTDAAIAALEDDGALTAVKVEGWAKPAYVHRTAKLPRRVEARTLLSPFDNLIFHRDRAAALFDAHIRLEIYTPAHKRTHGYYVLPFLMGERIVARVDLKAERKQGALAVIAAHLEDHAAADAVAPALAESLREMAAWLGLARVKIARRGGLAPALAAEARVR
ncbi:MAG TPA: crosslink repair DNA glycosylase YcaQ family protein [Caulobacterales bacterium]|nr:crosslink repair DNA glycosylase YcaQ family protein [Caulobacterales bacterium]